MVITEAELIRDILSNKFGHFEKFNINERLLKMLALGIASYDGEKWAKHRRIVNPAFHLEKLKVTSLHTTSIYIYWLTVAISWDSLQY